MRVAKLILAVTVVGSYWSGTTAAAGYTEQWDSDQERAVRTTIIPTVTRLADGATAAATFDKALARDPTAVPGLLALLDHRLIDVATAAAKVLGWFPGAQASAALKQRVASDPRLPMRVVALMALGRMRDPEADALAVQAVRGSDPAMQGAGGVALGLIGNSNHAAVVVEYLDQGKAAGDPPDEEAFAVLAAMGDPPGSTIVTDRLVSEANQKSSELSVRYAAAFALEKMGRGPLVQKLLDLNDADSTWGRMLALQQSIASFAASKNTPLNSQTALDAVLAQVEKDGRGDDYWGRPLRAVFVAPTGFNVISDGPDRTPRTADDMSTAELFDHYEARVFGGLF
jgi:HEAT repeat protein